VDGKSKSKMPRLLSLRRNPFKPACYSIFIREWIGAIALDYINLLAFGIKLHFCGNDFLNAFFFTDRIRSRVASKSVFDNFFGIAQE
jgi:hypothetical protein